MSVYSVATASPSRILGVLRFVLASPDQCTTRSNIESMMTPAGWNTDRSEVPSSDQEPGTGRGLLQPAFKESVRLGLLMEEEKSVRLGERVSRKLISEPRWWPLALFELIVDPPNRNQDLCRALAWFLGQDIISVPGSWGAMQSKNEILSALEMNIASFGQMQHWAAYLGLGWRCGREKRSLFVFDPTAHLKLRLSYELGVKTREFSATEFLKQLARWCPVLDDGSYGRELEEKHVLEPRTQGHVSSPLSQALLRLREEGWIEMSHASDAKAVLLCSGEEQERISQVRWKAGHTA